MAGYFPVGYQPVYNPYQYQQPAAPSSRMTEVYPVDSIKAVEDFVVGNGNTVMMISRDDSFIAVKSVGLDGSISLSVYDKRPPAPVQAPVDMGEYVTRRELDERLAAFNAPQRRVKKEAAEE